MWNPCVDVGHLFIQTIAVAVIGLHQVSPHKMMCWPVLGWVPSHGVEPAFWFQDNFSSPPKMARSQKLLKEIHKG